MSSAAQHYRSQLQAELDRRKAADRRYSLRTFAKNLRLSPSYLSKILNGQKHPSLDKAAAMASQLQLSADESLRFCRLVYQSNLKSPQSKKVLATARSQSRRAARTRQRRIAADKKFVGADGVTLQIEIAVPRDKLARARGELRKFQLRLKKLHVKFRRTDG